jgi:hypothetical protein
MTVEVEAVGRLRNVWNPSTSCSSTTYEARNWSMHMYHCVLALPHQPCQLLIGQPVAPIQWAATERNLVYHQTISAYVISKATWPGGNFHFVPHVAQHTKILHMKVPDMGINSSNKQGSPHETIHVPANRDQLDPS